MINITKFSPKCTTKYKTEAYNADNKDLAALETLQYKNISTFWILLMRQRWHFNLLTIKIGYF